MSSSLSTTDGRRPWVSRNPVGRFYAAASRISCGLIPGTSTQQPQPGTTMENVGMEETRNLIVPVNPENMSTAQTQQEPSPIILESTPNTTTQEAEITEGAPVPNFVNAEEIVPAAMEQLLVRMENTVNTVVPPAPTIETVLAQTPPLPPPPPPPPPPMMPLLPRIPVCIVCQETKETEDNKFPYKCWKCDGSDICETCLKEWFVDACKNESKMPAKCACSPIPVSCMSKVLSPEQINLYKAKYEESQTPDRLYCPVPTCSTFISPRLFVAPKSLTEEAMDFQISQITQLDGQTPQDPSFVLSMSLHGPAAKKPCVSCPGCEASVCTKCRSLEHVGECSGDLDPELAELLKKWRIKRCPKCRTGLRKVYGCSHVECRCGAHFCWQCLKPYSQCDQSCSDEDDDDESIEEDDLDGHAGFYEGDDHDFGDEPDNGILERWSCRHSFEIAEASESEEELECGHCFRAVSRMIPEVMVEVKVEVEQKEDVKDADGDSQMADIDASTVTQTLEASLPILPAPTPAANNWRCYNLHMFCTNCTKEPPASRLTDATYLYTCNCGKKCVECNVPKVAGKWTDILKERKKELERKAGIAWECECGAVICGSCKTFMDAQDENETMGIFMR